METLILGWYVLVETKSVLLLSLFASLQYLGTLLAPMAGVAGHRLGNRPVIRSMRCAYALLATTMMALAMTGALSPVHVFVIAGLMGLMRPSDMVMRYAVIGSTMPTPLLMGATSVSRTTQDSARVAGALTGAGLAVALGMGPAYVVVALLYWSSFALTLGVGVGKSTHGTSTAAATSAWRDLRDGLSYVWKTPRLRAAMIVAFLVNLSAFPLVLGLLPYVAKEIYRTGQTGLGYLVASFASGALVGSILLSRFGASVRAGRMILAFCAAWYCLTLVFAQVNSPFVGSAVLMLAGLSQSLCLVPLSGMLLRTSAEDFRSRVMGVRTLMIYGVPVGLMIAGPLIDRYGYPATATLYSVVSLACVAAVAVHWRAHLWRLDAPANAR
jgi:predicted MFS family arabinose efflux permease